MAPPPSSRPRLRKNVRLLRSPGPRASGLGNLTTLIRFDRERSSGVNVRHSTGGSLMRALSPASRHGVVAGVRHRFAPGAGTARGVQPAEHITPANPNTTLSSSDFGRVTSAADDPRICNWGSSINSETADSPGPRRMACARRGTRPTANQFVTPRNPGLQQTDFWRAGSAEGGPAEHTCVLFRRHRRALVVADERHDLLAQPAVARLVVEAPVPVQLQLEAGHLERRQRHREPR